MKKFIIDVVTDDELMEINARRFEFNISRRNAIKEGREYAKVLLDSLNKNFYSLQFIIRQENTDKTFDIVYRGMITKKTNIKYSYKTLYKTYNHK